MTTQRSRECQLPHGWAWSQLADIVDSIHKLDPSLNPHAEFTYIDISSIDNARHRITSPKRYLGSEAPSRARQAVRAGDILFSTVRTYLKNIAIVDAAYDGQVASTGFCVLRPLKPISARYLFYLTLTDGFVDPLTNLQRGTSYPAVRNSDVLRRPVPIAPANEQLRIVDKIEELFSQLDAGVAALESIKAQLQRYRHAVLNAAMCGELTREWRKGHNDSPKPGSDALGTITREGQDRVASPRSVGAAALPALPQQWTWTTLPQVGELNRGKSKHRPRNDPRLYGGPYPFIQTGDLRAADGVIRLYHQTYSEEGLRQSRLWPAGTLCITIAANIADTAVLGFDACFPDSVVGFLANPSACDVRFVEFFFRTVKADIDRYAHATAQKNINLRVLSRLPIPLPPLAEQRLIADRLGALLSGTSVVEELLDENTARAALLRQSILKRVFEGRLVPQDPSDEPAWVLLERIKADVATRRAAKGARRAKHKNHEVRAGRKLDLVQ